MSRKTLENAATDFLVADHGSIVLLIPCQESARDWIAENLPAETLTFGAGYAIERRYFGAIYEGIRADGLSLA